MNMQDLTTKPDLTLAGKLRYWRGHMHEAAVQLLMLVENKGVPLIP